MNNLENITGKKRKKNQNTKPNKKAKVYSQKMQLLKSRNKKSIKKSREIVENKDEKFEYPIHVIEKEGLKIIDELKKKLQENDEDDKTIIIDKSQIELMIKNYEKLIKIGNEMNRKIKTNSKEPNVVVNNNSSSNSTVENCRKNLNFWLQNGWQDAFCSLGINESGCNFTKIAI